MKRPFLVTGAAGFIGAALAKKLINHGEFVIGIDNLNAYYDRSLKIARVEEIQQLPGKDNWKFHKLSIEEKGSLEEVFKKYEPKVVIHLAAQAGVRYSIENPNVYIQSNLVGFSHILECCRNYNIENLLYASSSSVYGGNKLMPFSESQSVNHPVSLYAATKKANELMAHTYSHLYGLPATGLRFFTVYGPWGRPDMAPMIFTNSILNDMPINIFNNGEMERDFTYIDDIIEGVFRCSYKPATANKSFDPLNPDPATSLAPHRIFNIGNSEPTNLLEFIEILESAIKKKAKRVFKEIQPGDVVATYANTSELEKWIGFKPSTKIEKGIQSFVEWYRYFYKI